MRVMDLVRVNMVRDYRPEIEMPVVGFPLRKVVVQEGPNGGEQQDKCAP